MKVADLVREISSRDEKETAVSYVDLLVGKLDTKSQTESSSQDKKNQQELLNLIRKNNDLQK